MTAGEALRRARERIGAVDARILLLHVTGMSHAALIARPEAALDVATQTAFDTLVDRREAGEPVAYLIGWREFFGRRFAVGPRVLIPRPETELLVDLALREMAGVPSPRIVDLGTGSGVLAITLALERLDAEVTAVDLSVEALEVARGSAHALKARVRFVESDWYAKLGESRYDLIVANPPYVAPHDAHLAQGDLRFEPQTALVGQGKNGTGDLERIIVAAPRHLRAGGWLMLEHGYDQGAAVRGMLVSQGFDDIATYPDLGGVDRASTGRLGRAA